MKARLRCRGLPRADTKITVGFGPQAAAFDLALWLHQIMCSLFALRKGCLACKPSIARKPHHAREARASYRRREFAATTLKGLGGIRPAFFSATRRKAKRSSAGSLAQEHEKG